MAITYKSVKDGLAALFNLGGKEYSGTFVQAVVGTTSGGDVTELASQTTVAAALASLQTTEGNITAVVTGGNVKVLIPDGALSALGYKADTGRFDGSSASVVALLKGLGLFIGGAAVTPSDSSDLNFVARGLYVGAGGDLKVDFANGDTGVTLYSMPAGFIPIAVKRVYATGTTASYITALK